MENVILSKFYTKIVHRTFFNFSTRKSLRSLSYFSTSHKYQTPEYRKNSIEDFQPSLRFIQFCRKYDNSLHFGIVSCCGRQFIELPKTNSFPGDTISFMQLNLNARQIIDLLQSPLEPEEVTDDINLLPPVVNPEKIICIANNYCDSSYQRFQKTEMLFYNKLPNALIGPAQDIQIKSATDKLNFGIGLAVVIGKCGSNISKSEALEYVFGYTIAQDIMIHCSRQNFTKESKRTYCPLGPCIVHKCAIQNPQNLGLLCKVNGNLRQNSNTCNMICSVSDIIQEVSKSCTLKPGDIIITGTPGIISSNCREYELLNCGDCIMSEIQYIGKLLNSVIKCD